MMTISPIRTMFVVVAVPNSKPMMQRRIYTLYMTLVTDRDAGFSVVNAEDACK